MFRFPFTNFHELNLDWILSVVKEAKEVFDNGREDIDYAVETADEAKELAEQAVESVVPDNSITTQKIRDYAVTSDKIATYAVTTDKIQEGGITSSKILAGAVTTAKIGGAANLWRTFFSVPNCTFISSGSMHDVNESGLYYMGNSVTDKPDTYGGLLVFMKANETTKCGLYLTNTNDPQLYGVSVVGTTWSYKLF